MTDRCPGAVLERWWRSIVHTLRLAEMTWALLFSLTSPVLSLAPRARVMRLGMIYAMRLINDCHILMSVTPTHSITCRT